MAGRNKNQPRIEPSFGGGLLGTGIRLTSEDRAVANHSPKKSNAASTSAGTAKTDTRKKQAADGNRSATSRAHATTRRKSGGSGGRGGKPPAKQRGLISRLFRASVYWCFVLGIWSGIGIAGLVGYYGMKMPQASDWSIPDRPPNARIVSVDGELIANRGVTGGEAVRLDEMSPYIPMAVIAIEDRRFKSHYGIDPLGIARAMAINVVSGRLVQGGSTLTQQLAKNLFLEPRRDLERKVQEAILALWLEHRFSKDEILELYLNRVYFGSGAYGVDAAARRYFGKSARDVNLAEAALIAGLLKAPSKLSPARDQAAAEERGQLVLASMLRERFITDSEMATALTMEAKKAKRYWSGSQYYVADLVMKQLPQLIGSLRKDVIVDTTVDLNLQKEAGTLIRETISKDGKKLNVSQGALVSLDGTGAIRAMVGGAEYADSQFNRAVDAKRQPGSAFKPIVYLAAIEQGRTPETVRVDRAVAIGKWKPSNYDNKFRGPVTLSESLSQSLNTIAVQLISEVGPKSVVETAAKLGIKSTLERNSSIALGTSEVTLLELTGAYSAFANGGFQVDPFLIKRVTTMDGEVLYERNASNLPRVLDGREVGMMNAMLRRTVEEGTGKAAKIKGWEVAGKTGTTQNFRDALFVGYTANLTTGVWYGNDDGSFTKKVTGGTLPAQTFASFMKTAHKGVPVSSLPGHYDPAPDNFNVSGDAVASDRSSAPLEDKIANVLEKNSDAPRPVSSVGSQTEKRKPKGILDLLFGNRN